MSLLSRLFNKPKNTVAPPASATFYTAPSPAPEVIALLSHWAVKRQLLSARIAGGTEDFMTMVLAVDPARGLVWLDELNPATALLGESDTLILSDQVHGEILSLELPFVASKSFQREALACLLPSQIQSRPRRQWMRFGAPVTPEHMIVRALGEAAQTAQLINLSAGGARLALRGNFLSQLQVDSFLPVCEFRLGEKLWRMSATVKSARLARASYRQTQVSVEFADISQTDKRAIDQHLQRLHRLQRLSAQPQAA
ncbi:flagellar brake protein [Gilvimarinus xylanilyticus]|uniref:Flagellar brake protein n=1 Tax=Gilvimarinus xylanilyticus TaxID=2944139 RepID=A0A9X2KSW0_9GAMM|nr:flagellar brake protein [Gilvimarinus xylanilyticus]MCP8898649.1 flagellar brake protein [Gilvimarinus xylanilyticus]